MNIDYIEDNLSKISESNYFSIIELIVDAVRTYPLKGLNDTDDYFSELKTMLNVSEINLEVLKNYLDFSYDIETEKTIWIVDSLSSLIEAYELMDLYKISLNEVMEKIEALR